MALVGMQALNSKDDARCRRAVSVRRAPPILTAFLFFARPAGL